MPSLPPPLEVSDGMAAGVEAMADAVSNDVIALRAAIVSGQVPRSATAELNRMQAEAEWLREVVALVGNPRR